MDPRAYCIPVMGDKRDWCGRDLIRADLRPVNPCVISSSTHQAGKKEPPPTPKKPADGSINTKRERVKRTKGIAKKPLCKFNSTVEVIFGLVLQKIKIIHTYIHIYIHILVLVIHSYAKTRQI